MKATDGVLVELARKARVRPAHVFHFAAYRRQMKANFSPEGYAAFASMDLAHVLRMIVTLDAYEAEIVPAKKSGTTKMPADFIAPPEWRLWAQTEKGWTRDVADTEAAKFVDYWHGKGAARASWEATWRNWVRSDFSPAGVIMAGAQERWTAEEQKAYLERMGR